MDIINKLKIRIRRRGSANPVRVEVHEKLTYSCRACHNQYYDHHLYCPQCLAEVTPAWPKPSLLRIVSVPREKTPELAHLLATLTGKKDFGFQKALEALPWIMMQQTDECILLHWKEILEAEKAEAEIASWQPGARRRWRGKAPLYASNAPAPHFFSEATGAGVRHVAQSMKDSSVRMKWVEAVLAGFHIIEDFYKRHPTHRMLFSDFLFHIDRDLLEAVKDYDSLFKAHETDMTERIVRIRAQFDTMANEIQEVRKQVEESL